MNIDFSIIDTYLDNKPDYQNHWVFSVIKDDGAYCFTQPNPSNKQKINALYNKIVKALENFTPYNSSLLNRLFPNWVNLLPEVNIILTVGCPNPYDAMVRGYKGTEYMIFDLAILSGYDDGKTDIVAVIKRLITHEFIHICIRQDYPATNLAYQGSLQHIAFDEGFAHLLSFTENVETFNFTQMIDTHYNISIEKFSQAKAETDIPKQKVLLDTANTGAYWQKFAAISGKLFLAKNITQLENIYKKGPTAMFL